MVIISEFNFPTIDEETQKFLLSNEDIIENIDEEQVTKILYALGADRHEERSNYLIFPTICHNEDVEEASMKLYYYPNNHLFKCYTECDRGYNIISLVQKVKDISFEEARKFIVDFIDLGHLVLSEKSYESILDRYQHHLGIVTLPQYNPIILEAFVDKPYVGWLQDGMSAKAISDFNIKFSIAKNAVVIPHYDVNDRLVGIRVRNLSYSKDGDIPKYCPLIFTDITYSHPLSLNLFGLNKTKDAIKRKKKVIIFESEKSVILFQTYYEEDNNSVAVCGSNLSKSQISLLLKYCQPEEIIVAFDREYDNPNSTKAINYFYKLRNICLQYVNYANMSFIYDFDYLIKEKDAPIDCGKDTFEQLCRNRIRVK